MQRLPVWLIATEATFRELLRDVLSQAGCDVLDACTPSSVCQDVIGGKAGVVVADATELLMHAAYRTQLNEYCYLSTSVPLLLLTNDPETIGATRAALGQCEVLAQPLNDLDRVVELVSELGRKLNLRAQALGSAF